MEVSGEIQRTIGIQADLAYATTPKHTSDIKVLSTVVILLSLVWTGPHPRLNRQQKAIRTEL